MSAKALEEASEPAPGSEPAANKGEGDVVAIQELDGEEEIPEKKKTWGSRVGYMLTLVGYAVGFGNIWRFPYMLQANGGLAFLIPYTFMLLFIGMPVFFLELAVGQRRRKGIVQAWNEISPAFGGLGICAACCCYMCGLYYSSLLSYSLSYMIDSFRDPLPWYNCSTVSNDVKEQRECSKYLDGKSTKYYWFRKTLGASTGLHDPGGYDWFLFMYHVLAWAFNWVILARGSTEIASVAYFSALFPYVVLIIFFIGNFIQNPVEAWRGAWRCLRPNWGYLLKGKTWFKAGGQIFFSLGVAACIVVFSSHNPARYDCHKDAITISIVNCATSMFAALVVFPVVGALGHKEYGNCVKGVENLITLKMWEKNKENFYDIYFATSYKGRVPLLMGNISEETPLKVKYGYGEWEDIPDSQMEVFYDSSMIKMELVPEGTHLESVLRNCSIAHEAFKSGDGTGLVFMGFTQAVLQMKGSNFWSFLFFLMLFTLGIDSAFGTIEGAIVAVEELFKVKRRLVSTSIVCGSLTVLSLAIFPFGWGIYLIDYIDQWCANWTLLAIGVGECIAVSWSYGLARFSYDVMLMTGKKPNIYMIVCWKYITPTIICGLLIYDFVHTMVSWADEGVVYDTFDLKSNESDAGTDEKKQPSGSIALGIILLLMNCIWWPLQAILRKTKFSLVRHEAESDFPEEELRDERKMDVDKEDEHFSGSEKVIMGKGSLQDLQSYRDRKKSVSSLRSQNSIVK